MEKASAEFTAQQSKSREEYFSIHKLQKLSNFRATWKCRFFNPQTAKTFNFQSDMVFLMTIFLFLWILRFPPPQVARAGKYKIHKNSKTVIKNTKNGHDDITNASKIVRRGQKPPQKISTHSISTNMFVMPTPLQTPLSSLS